MIKLAPFEQDVICFIWDFDKTLIPGYMQEPLFKKYGIDGPGFWDEVNSLPDYYKDTIPRVNKDTIYLNHILTYVKHGVFNDLNNAVLRSLGSELEFYPGLPEFLTDSKTRIEQNEEFRSFGITVEHYVVSTGLAEVIRGSRIFPLVDGVWGCEFIENPKPPRSQARRFVTEEPEIAVVSQIAYAIDNTSKTRALFEINKGSNRHREIDVNAAMDWDIRRVPFPHMIYIADGPSDVPSFSVVRQYGGRTYAVYPQGDTRAFKQVEMLRKDGRVDMYGEADYRENSQTYLWLTSTANEIAQGIVNRKKTAIRASTSKAPSHLV